MKTKVCAIALIGSLLGSGIAWAVDSQRFPESGVITSFERNARTLVVEDTGYRLSPTLRVYSQTGQTLSVDVLQKGRKIGFNITLTAGTSEPVINEIVLMPAN